MDRIRAGEREALDDVQAIGLVVARAIEPCLAVEAGDVDDQRVAFPPSARPSHPGIERAVALREDPRVAAGWPRHPDDRLRKPGRVDKALELGAYRVVTKPFDVTDIASVIRCAHTPPAA